MVIKVLCRFPVGDLRFATQNIPAADGNWQNKIIDISSLSRNIGEDKSYEISGMSLEMNDNDRLSGLDISDVVEIRHPGAIDENKRKYQVRRVDMDFLNDVVQMECIDITSLSGGIFILGDETIAGNWEQANDYERQYAYLCDDDGFFANDSDEGKMLY